MLSLVAQGSDIVKTYNFADLTATDLREIVTIHGRGAAAHEWTQVDQIGLDAEEKAEIQRIIARLLYRQTSLMNEATIWARAIYPLLVMAEQATIQAWAGVPLDVTFPHAILTGTIDGALASKTLGEPDLPYLVITEAETILKLLKSIVARCLDQLSIAAEAVEEQLLPSLFNCPML